MQIPKIPSIFKTRINKKFNLQTRYYDGNREDVGKIKNGYPKKIQFKNNRSIRKGRSIDIFVLFVFLIIILLLILKS